MDEREIFEAWATTLDLDLTLVAGDHYSDCNTDFAWLAWCAARRTTPDRDAIIEECARACERVAEGRSVVEMNVGAKLCADAVRALKTTPTTASTQES